VKLAAELARPDTGRTLYILDEPTTGLHFDDVRKLLDVIHRLADLGNTVVVIEHNLEVIKTADWVIDLGPEAGTDGGDLVAEGTPEQIVKDRRSHTGKFLGPVLAAGPRGRLALPAAEVESGKLAPKGKRSGEGIDRAKSPEASQSAENNGKSGAKKKGVGDSIGSSKSGARSRGVDVEGQAKAPWEIDGRSWHTRDRVAGNGRPARWDGRILEIIVDRIEELGPSESGFAETEWSQRGVVRINSVDKTKIAFPFFHATTSSEWFVTLRFFVPKKTFIAADLQARLKLVPFHESETPVLCDHPRLKFSSLGPFQEITIVGHAVAEFETPAFAAFLKKSIKAYLDMGKLGKIKVASEL
jgi:excinuclease ABC subunit A